MSDTIKIGIAIVMTVAMMTAPICIYLNLIVDELHEMNCRNEEREDDAGKDGQNV